MPPREVEIRAARGDDARAILEAHRSAVHATAAAHYSLEIRADWSPPVTEERLARWREHLASDRVVLVAEAGGAVVGFGELEPATALVRAVYVSADFGGRGAGSALLAALESRARALGLRELRLESTLNAEGFYRKHGFESLGPGVHKLRSGREMACVRMRKVLGGQAGLS